MLMVAPVLGIPGPIPEIARCLADEFGSLGWAVELLSWGRRTQHDSLLAKARSWVTSLWAIRRAARSQPHDLLLIQTSHEWRTLVRDIPLVLLARVQSSATVVHFHGSQPDRLIGHGSAPFALGTRVLLRLVDGVLVLSDEELRAFRRFDPGTEFRVVLNPLLPLPACTDAGRFRRACGIPTSARCVLFVGRLKRSKGVFDALGALARLPIDTRPHMIIAGDGPRREEAQTVARDLGLTERVVFLGHVDRESLACAYSTSDMLVLPTYWGEGLPMVILEALNYGVPVITTPTRGAKDILTEETHCLFVPPRRPEILAETIRRLLENDELRRKLSAENLLLSSVFAPERVARGYMLAVESMLAGRRGRP